jgi:hypothetical protein
LDRAGATGHTIKQPTMLITTIFNVTIRDEQANSGARRTDQLFYALGYLLRSNGEI